MGIWLGLAEEALAVEPTMETGTGSGTAEVELEAAVPEPRLLRQCRVRQSGQ